MPVFRPALRKHLATAILCGIPFAALSQDTALLKTAVWWDPAESGWGLYIADQGSVIGPIWYTYDDTGKPTWYLVPGAYEQSDGSYTGPICQFSGVPYPQIVGKANDPCDIIGSATLNFDGDSSLTFDYVIGDIAQSKNLQRFNYKGQDIACRATENPSRVNASNYTDKWWGGVESDGWGMHINHVDNSLYATWYTYDLDGRAVFYIGSTERQTDGSYSGTLSAQKPGTAWFDIDGEPPSEGSEVIGNVRFTFSDGENASFSYTIGNVSQSRTIKRMQFGSTAAVCEAVPYTSIHGDDDNGQPGADECYPPLTVGDKYRLRDTAPDGSTTVTDVEVVGTGVDPFQGRPVFKVSYTPQGNANGSIIEFVEQTPTERIYYGAEGWIPAVSARGQTRFDPPVKIPRSTPVGYVGNRTYKAISNYVASGQTVNNTVDFVEIFERVGTETQTVPAGSFQGACRFETSLDSVTTSTQAGFTIRITTEADVIQWAHPSIGPLRTDSQSTSTSTVSGSPFPVPPTVTNSSNKSEIVSGTVGGRNFP